MEIISEERIGGSRRGERDDGELATRPIARSLPLSLRVPQRSLELCSLSTPRSAPCPSPQLSALAEKPERKKGDGARKVKRRREGVDGGGGGRSVALSSLSLLQSLSPLSRTSGLTQRYLSPTLAILGATPDIVLLAWSEEEVEHEKSLRRGNFQRRVRAKREREPKTKTLRNLLERGRKNSEDALTF